MPGILWFLKFAARQWPLRFKMPIRPEGRATSGPADSAARAVHAPLSLSQSAHWHWQAGLFTAKSLATLARTRGAASATAAEWQGSTVTTLPLSLAGPLAPARADPPT